LFLDQGFTCPLNFWRPVDHEHQAYRYDMTAPVERVPGSGRLNPVIDFFNSYFVDIFFADGIRQAHDKGFPAGQYASAVQKQNKAKQSAFIHANKKLPA
jgi:hypothetical protein